MASSLYSQWKGLALASDQHLLAAYGLANSWTLGYNLFADVWLGTSVVESSVYNGQSIFIDNVMLTSNFSKYGMPVDNYNTDTSTAASSWTLFVAAMTPDQDLCTNLISRVHNRASYNATAGVFPVLYDSSSGLIDQGGASPVQGAMYAPLALKAPVLQISASPMPTATSSQSKLRTGAIVGGAIGGMAALLTIGVITLVARRRRSRNRKRQPIEPSFETDVSAQDGRMTVTPFNATLVEATALEAGSQTNLQPRWIGPVGPENIPSVPNSASPDSPALSSRVASLPVGLYSRDLARLHPDRSRSQPTDPLPSGPTLAVTTILGAATSSSEAPRLQSVEHLMQEPHAERPEAPPSYEDGGA